MCVSRAGERKSPWVRKWSRGNAKEKSVEMQRVQIANQEGILIVGRSYTQTRKADLDEVQNANQEG